MTVLDQRPLIEAVLRVANLSKPLEDPAAIYGLFDPFADSGRVARLSESGAAGAAILWRDIVGYGEDAAVPTLWRVGVVGVLNRICRSLDAARREYSAAIDEALVTAGTRLVATPRLEGHRLHVALKVAGYGCQAVEAIALALLLDNTARIDKSRTYGEALRHCAYSHCDRFFLSFTTKSGGRPSRYHAPACKAAHYKILRAVREGWAT